MRTILKSLIDQLVAWTVLIVLSPLMYLLALGLWLSSPGPVFFRQERIGKGGRSFVVLKYRTMKYELASRSLDGQMVSEESRITSWGRLLRNTSLDELPQLINVINRDMSLVGPRPTLDYQVANYNEFQRRRLLMKPGITGWAQINGRNSIPWSERIKLDVWYVENWSLRLDWKILFRTFRVWLKQEGLYGPGGLNDNFINSTENQGMPPRGIARRVLDDTHCQANFI
jgi:lipopolysaccharide/colanic/teichoic acid biosynthesis glycosyltransferase